MKSSSEGLKVFDFNEHDDEAELIDAECASKFKSSNAIDNYRFLQNVAQGKDTQLKEIGKILCVDVDTINSDHNGDSTAPISSLEEGEDCEVKRTSALDTVTQVGSNLAEQLPQVGPNELEPRSSFSRMEVSSSPEAGEDCAVKRTSALDSVPQIGSSLQFGPNKLDPRSSFPQMEGSSMPEAVSPGNSKFSYPRLESSSSDESIDAGPDADESMSERSPSTSSDIAEDDVPLDGPSSDHCFGNWQMGDEDSAVACFPDYIVYRDKYITDSVLTFSSSCIEIKGSNAYGDHGTFVSQWGVDDVVNIESQWCERFELAMVKISVIAKGSVPVEDIHETSGIEELKFAVVDSNWCEKQEAITCLDVYKPLWNIVLDFDIERDGEALIGQNGVLFSKQYFPTFKEPFEDVIYPKGDPDAVSISKRDIDLLQPDTFVNDTIIDFYIKYLKNKIQPDERHRFHFFNSFFFRKLADLDKNPSSALEGRAAFQRVRKWTRKMNLFEKDYVFIPVNFNYHWSLIVICHPGEVAEFQDADAGKSLKVPCILHMDSIRGNHSGLKGLLQSYLWEEWKERQKEASEDTSSRFLNLRFLSLELPQQQNSFDCGLFLLHYAELFLEGIPVNFNPFKIVKFSNFLTADWFQHSEASLKRACIQRLIYDLLDKAYHENSPDAESDKHCTSNCPKSIYENETAVEFLSDRCSPSKAFHGNLLSSQADRGIEITLLPTSSLKSSQCASDSGFVLRELFEPGAAVGSFHQAFDQTEPLDDFKIAMPPMEGEEDAGRHFGCSPSVETGHEQLSAITTEACGYPSYLSRDLRGEPSWNPEITVDQAAHEDLNSLPEASICDSDDSLEEEDVNDSQVGINLSLEEKIDQPRPPSTDNIECLMDTLASAPSEMLDPDSQNNHDQMLNGNDNADPLTSCPKNLLGLSPRDCDTKENGNGTCDDSVSEPNVCDDSVSEPNVQHAAKKRRLTPLEGEGGLTRSVSGDLHL